jgi:crotonobetainyl-CoA:carnitine CoA-transferase CaiB-like acyl-CoA transferase
MGALTGVRVLDFTRVLAGPLCTMMLGDLGADIIKVESKDGDETRQWGPPWAGVGDEAMSAYYLSVNRNKRSIVLDLKTESGQAKAKELALTADILVENFKVGQMASFGLDFATLQALNPKLVYCSISGFGQEGKYADRAGYDFAIQALGGLMAITGEPAGESIKVGVAISDVLAGLYASNAILAALRHAEHTGEGQHIDIALLDTTLASLVNVASNYLVSGNNPKRYGNAHANIVPYQTFHARDGAFVVACGNDKQFKALCNVIQRPELAQDPDYSTNPQRVVNREALGQILGQVFIQQSKLYWVDVLLKAGVPSAPIQSVQEALEDDNTVMRGLIQQVTLPNGLEQKIIGSPLKFSATPVEIRYPPPQIGEHNDEI